MRFQLRRRQPAPAQGAMAEPNARIAVLAPYTSDGFWHNHRRLGMALIGLVAFLYGFAFALTTTYFLLQLLVPLLVLGLMIVWVLPETGKAPIGVLEKLFAAFLVALLGWPDYLALALPGLPWITAVRLVSVPLAIVLLLSLSQSQNFRRELADILKAIPALWKLLAALALLALVSVAVSRDPGASLSKFIVGMTTWIQVCVIAAYVFVRPGRVKALACFLWVVVIAVCLIGIQEARHSVVPWAGHIPSFLKIEDPTVQRILAGASRAATGIYRVQSKFTTSLGLAEVLVYAMPFVVHLVVTAKTLATRVACMATLPLLLYTIIKTDSRLGMVGFFSTILLYFFYWGAVRWHTRRDSAFGPAAVLSFPVISVVFFISTFFIGRLGALIWGTGAQSFSSEARKQQVAEGLPKVWSHPWGYGIGQSAEALGFTNLADVLTIDTYYLAVALELGVIGFLVYYGMFIWAILAGAREALGQYDEDTAFIGPILIALTNFVIIKSIFSQTENHPLVFALLGALLALVYRIKRARPPVPPAGRAAFA